MSTKSITACTAVGTKRLIVIVHEAFAATVDSDVKGGFVGG